MTASEVLNNRARLWTAFALKLVVSVGILVACFTLLDVHLFPTVLGRTNVSWFGFALVLAVIGTVMLPAMITKKAIQIERLSIELKELILINFAVRFYVLVLPRALSIGIRWMRYRQGGSGHDALALMIYERLIQLFTMMAIGLIMLSTESATLGTSSVFISSLMGLVTLILGLALAPFLFPATTPLLIGTSKLADRFTPELVARRVHKLLDAVRAFQGLPAGTGGYTAALSLISYALFIFSPFVLVLAMQLDVSLVALSWIRPIVFLFTLIPFTVGGLGIREAGFIGLLHLYGLPNHEALALALGVFAIQVVIGLIGAATEIWRYAVVPAVGRKRSKEVN